MTDAESTAETPDVVDAGLARAGAAAAARRRELDISQRSLAADGIINAGALIASKRAAAGHASAPEQSSKRSCNGRRGPSRGCVRVSVSRGRGRPSPSPARTKGS